MMKRTKLRIRNESGIYCILNIVDGKCYIGKSIALFRRIRDHKNELKLGKHINDHLQNAWKKYGMDNFQIFALEYCDENELECAEMFWIWYYKSYGLWDQITKKIKQSGKFGYNLTPGGDDFDWNLEVQKKASETWRKNHFETPLMSREGRKRISEMRKKCCALPGYIPPMHDAKTVERARKTRRENIIKAIDKYGISKKKMKAKRIVSIAHFLVGLDSPWHRIPVPKSEMLRQRQKCYAKDKK